MTESTGGAMGYTQAEFEKAMHDLKCIGHLGTEVLTLGPVGCRTKATLVVASFGLDRNPCNPDKPGAEKCCMLDMQAAALDEDDIGELIAALERMRALIRGHYGG